VIKKAISFSDISQTEILPGKHNFYKIRSVCQLLTPPENYQLFITKTNFYIANKIKKFHFLN